MRAVAIHLKSSCTPTRSLPSRGVPGMGTSALTGNDSGGSGSLREHGMGQYIKEYLRKKRQEELTESSPRSAQRGRRRPRQVR